MITAQQIKEKLFAFADEQKKNVITSFFKTGKGDYSEGDIFLGVTVPQQRKLVDAYQEMPLAELQMLLREPFHECRMTALLFLIKMFKQPEKQDLRDCYFRFYCSNIQFVNNWDLVDCSAPIVVGEYLLSQKDISLLKQWALHGDLWQQRIAIVATLAFIRVNKFDVTFSLAEILLNHNHDLIQKSVGWMLREVGKRNYNAEYDFLIENGRYKKMPRTMLRYAIERFPESIRQNFLKGVL